MLLSTLEKYLALLVRELLVSYGVFYPDVVQPIF